MKAVINKCYGGFSISAKAVARLAELKGRPCYFFKQDIGRGLDAPMEPISVEEADASQTYTFFAFDVPDPNEFTTHPRQWSEMSMEERQAHNARYSAHYLESRPDERHDQDLIRVVEELGPAANGKHADLKVVELPDGIEYHIDEYDGVESIHELHRVWR